MNPTTVVQGSVIQVNFTVRNDGDVDASTSSYRILARPAAGGPGTWLTSSFSLPAVAALGSYAVQAPRVSTGGLGAGTYIVGPYVDDQNLVAESNEFNNFVGTTLTVNAGSVPLAIMTTSLSDASVWTAYDAVLGASGGTSPYSWSVVNGQLPPGLSLTAGHISGTPVSSGKNHRFTVQVTDGAGQTATQPLTLRVTGATLTVFNTDFASAGVGGIWDSGNGTLAITGVPSTATITKALLYWEGPTTVTDATWNAIVSFDNQIVTGTNIGFTEEDCFAGGFINCQAYRADVTDIVRTAQAQAPPRYSYPFANFVKLTGSGDQAQTNGISLLVFYDDGDPSNNKDVYLFDGADNNYSGVLPNVFDSPGWEMTMTSVNRPAGGTVTLQLHVGGGQVEYRIPH